MAIEKVVYVPLVPATRWIAELVPAWSPVELMIAGRRFIDYSLERAQYVGVKSVEIRDWAWKEKLAKEYSVEGSYPIDIVYTKGEGPVPEGLDDLERTGGAISLEGSGRTGVVWGACLSGRLPNEVRLVPVSSEDRKKTPIGVYIYDGGAWLRVIPGGVSIDCAKAWYRTCFAVLHNPGKFTLPGYSAEECVYLGRNVAIEHGATVKPAVLLNDNTWIGRNVQIDGDVIVGHDSFIGEGTRLKRTIVCPHTYIGTTLDFENKIIAGGRVIDPGTGSWADLEEPEIANDINGGFRWLRGVWRFLRGHSHGGGR